MRICWHLDKEGSRVVGECLCLLQTHKLLLLQLLEVRELLCVCVCGVCVYVAYTSAT